MLQFILGRPATGKTYTVLKRIEQDQKAGGQVILLVPEQYSFESERAVLSAVGDSGMQSVSVLSFNKLCSEIERLKGGFAGTALTDAHKVILMNRAMSAVSGNLKVWSRYASSLNFSKTMLETVGELKLNAIYSNQIREAAALADSFGFKNKLSDTAEIYEAYEALVGEKFIDPSDRLTKLWHSLEDFPFFKGKSVYLDSFKGFTGQQFKILKRIIAQANSVTISLTYDAIDEREYDIFSNIRKVKNRIERFAESYNKEILPPVVLQQSRYAAKGLIAVEQLLSGRGIEPADPDGSIGICRAATVHDEARFAARTIRRLVRSEGYRYRDFVIIARDTERYEQAVLMECEKNGIACFADRRTPLSSFPAAVAVDAAIASAKSFSTDQLLKFHKTGLGTLSIEEISDLENYALLWNINGAMWNTEWTMDPRGMVPSKELSEKNVSELKRLNELRERACLPINKFRENFAGTAADMSRAIVELFELCRTESKLSKLSESLRLSDSSEGGEVLKQSYEIYIGLLDCLVRCFGEETLSRSRFVEALRLAVSLSSVGTVPQYLDEVTFGAADRIRPSRPKVAFILGCNQGVFPQSSEAFGIFSAKEREGLIELGIEIPDNTISFAVDENYLIYSSLCCASHRLYLSFADHSISGEKYEPSAFVSKIKSGIPVLFFDEPSSCITQGNLPETSAAAFEEFCIRLPESLDDAYTVKAGVSDSQLLKRWEKIESHRDGKSQRISPETAEKLFGRDIKMSASRFDTFNRCHFSYFCKYGLKLKKIEPVEFSVLQRGTLIHYVMERVVSDYKKELAGLSDTERDTVIDQYIEEYLASVKGYKEAETPQLRFAVSRMSRALKEVVAHLASEFAQSDFEPVYCELKIGENGDTPAIEFPFDDGKILLSGMVDRIDVWNGYIRVVDYKTGSKTFKLPDILFGLNMQMLIYLYAAVRGDSVLKNLNPAGIFYMPAKRDLNENGHQMNGLILENREVTAAMEKENAGEFIPELKYTKSGTLAAASPFISEENFEQIFDYIEILMRKTGKAIRSGDIGAVPIDGRENAACEYCDFNAVCLNEQEDNFRVPNLKRAEVFERIEEVKNSGV